LAKARHLLAEAGYPNGFKTEFLQPSGQSYDLANCEYVIGQIHKIGIAATMQVIARVAWVKALRNGDYVISLRGDSERLDPDDAYYQYLHSGEIDKNNWSRYSKKEIDELKQAGITPGLAAVAQVAVQDLSTLAQRGAVSNVQRGQQSRIIGPVSIGAGTTIEGNVLIGPYTSIGEGCTLRSHTKIFSSSIYNHAVVGRNCTISGSVIDNDTVMGEECSVENDTIIGPRVVIRDGVVVHSGTRIWPEVTIGEKTIVREHLLQFLDEIEALR
jgi:acetyltransferase-like isoleucine patch superfamily enzyme